MTTCQSVPPRLQGQHEDGEEPIKSNTLTSLRSASVVPTTMFAVLKLSLHLTPSTPTRSDPPPAPSMTTAILKLAVRWFSSCAFERASRRAAAAYGVDYLAAISPSCML